MKLKGTFARETFGNETVMVSMDNPSFNGMLRANETAAFILQCLSVETTEDVIVNKVISHYSIDGDRARASVCRIICKLRDNGLLE